MRTAGRVRKTRLKRLRQAGIVGDDAQSALDAYERALAGSVEAQRVAAVLEALPEPFWRRWLLSDNHHA